MKYATIARITCNLMKAKTLHKEQAFFYLSLFKQHSSTTMDLTVPMSPLLNTLQLLTEYHTAQILVIDSLMLNYQEAVDNTFFE